MSRDVSLWRNAVNLLGSQLRCSSLPQHRAIASPGSIYTTCLGSNVGSNIPSFTPFFSRFQSLATSATQQRSITSRVRQRLQDYKQLSKFKLSSLVVLTSAAGFVAGSGEQIDWAGLGWTALGTFGAAACANTLNQMYEVVNDSKMTRTCNRPLPAGRMTKWHAAAFCITMGATGLGILYEKTNPLTAYLGAANIALYAGVYTPLKQLSVANTWVGALVGAIPPLMGWAAASGSLEPGSLVLATALFSWQMPHFLSLAWLCKDDYIRGGFQMLSRIDPNGRRTAMAALRHCAYLAPIGLLSYIAGTTTWPFAFEAAAMSAALGLYSLRFAGAPGQQTARSLFKLSLLYLPLLMLAMGVHRLPNTHSVGWEEMMARLQHLLQTQDVLGAVGRALDSVRDAVSDAAMRVDSDSLLVLVKCPAKVQCKDIEQTPANQPGSHTLHAASASHHGRMQRPFCEESEQAVE